MKSRALIFSVSSWLTDVDRGAGNSEEARVGGYHEARPGNCKPISLARSKPQCSCCVHPFTRSMYNCLGVLKQGVSPRFNQSCTIFTLRTIAMSICRISKLAFLLAGAYLFCRAASCFHQDNTPVRAHSFSVCPIILTNERQGSERQRVWGSRFSYHATRASSRLCQPR